MQTQLQLRPIGSQWLKERYHLSQHVLTHCSYIGNNAAIELTSKGNVEQIYGPGYKVKKDEPLYHLEFSLKYDDLNLDFLRAVFEKITPAEMEKHVAAAPGSKYTRKIGFLYEFLIARQIGLTRPVSGNYVNVLEEGKYIPGQPIKNTRWRINNNLLGTPAFCPVIRRTRELNDLLSGNIREKIVSLKENYPEELFKRAISYLYNKETRSSYEIEKEQPSPDRVQKFVALLIRAGMETGKEMLDKDRLIRLQNAIVDPRFAATAFRDFQNYVGETLPIYLENIHYICPPPSIVASLMTGLQDTAIKTIGIPAEVRATLIAFGFVFIHPFEDGNGRLHRFLIHDTLVQDGMVPQGLIIPVSAHMLNHIKDYDHILERYSQPLMGRVRFNKKENGEIAVTNEEEIEGYYRYPDLTDHCVYLIHTLHATLAEDMPRELLFIQRYDEAKKELQRIVDMPDKLIGMMLTFLHQNKGIFPKRRREYFDKLTDDEILQMQQAYRKIYEIE